MSATLRRSGRNARPQALKEPKESGSDDSEEEAFAEPESPSKNLTSPQKKKGRVPRKAKAKDGAENKSPNSRAADLQDPENYVDRVEHSGDQFLKDILADHLDPESEDQSATVTLLNIVGQYAGRLKGREWTSDDYPAQTLEDLAEAIQESVDKARSQPPLGFTLQSTEASIVPRIVPCIVTHRVHVRISQDGGIDHFKLTLRNGAVRKPAERLKVRKKVEHFWYSLTMEAHTQNIDVLELLDPICDLCILLCASLTWVTRYATVTVALSVMTALVDIMAQEEDRRSMLDRQLKASASKQSRRSTGTPAAKTPEAKSLQRERDRVHATVSILSKRLASLFDCIVVERCRDTQAAVRTDVVEAVGTWTSHCPGQFMEDKYLRYLAWGMADREPSVRLASIHAITKLLTDEEDAEALGPFVERFRHRILETAADVDDGVCSATLSLLQLLLQHGMVNLAQLAPIIRWFDPATHTGSEVAFRPVATQAAELIAEAVRSHAAEVEQSEEENTDARAQPLIPKASPSQAQATPDGAQRGGTQRAAKDKAKAAIAGAGSKSGASKRAGGGEDESDELSLLTALRSLFRLLAAEQAQQAHLPLPHSIMMLLVTHLQPQLPVLTNWQSLVPCLTADVTEGLPQVEIQDLATLTACCVEAGVAAEISNGHAVPPARKGKNKRSSKDGVVRSLQQEATLVLMDTLPEFLKDWSTDQHIVGELVGMMCHLDYSLFISHKRTAAFRTLVADVARLFNRMHDVKALTACTQALAHCSQLPQAGLSEPAKAACESVLTSTLEKLQACGDQLVNVDESVLLDGRAAIVDGASQDADTSKRNKESAGANANLVFAMHGAIRRAMRLAMHGAWNLQLAANPSAREQVIEVIAAYLAGRPVPTTLVRGALWTLWYLLVAEIQLMYRMAREKGSSRAALSQEGLANDISNVAQAARTLLVDLIKKTPKEGSSQLTPSSQNNARTIDALDVRKHAMCALIEVLCLCNSQIAESSDNDKAMAEARQLVEGLELEVSDDVADALWAFAEGLLDEKCRLNACVADLEENSDPEYRTQKEADEINRVMQYDSTLLRMCKETTAGLMRSVLCGSLGTHCVAFTGQLLAHTPLPHGDLQTMVLAFIACVPLKLKKQAPHMVADGISHALQTIFDELCMVDSSRYGLEDFDEIAAILSRPLTEYGTPQPMLASLWSAAAAFVSKDPSSRTEYFTYAMVHFIPTLSAETSAAVLKKIEAGATDQDEAPIMSALAAAEDRGTEFLAALHKRASKKPMPSAIRGAKGRKPAAQRKRITFMNDDADDNSDGNENPDNGGGEHDDGNVQDSDEDVEDAPSMDTKAKTRAPRSKGKNAKSGGGRQAANMDNVKKLVDLGGGWKRRAHADEPEDGIEEDDVDHKLVPSKKTTGQAVQHQDKSPSKTPTKNTARKKGAHSGGSPAGTPGRVTRRSSQAERDDLHSHADSSPLLAAKLPKSARNSGANAQHTPPKPFGSPLGRRSASTRGAPETPGSLHASEDDAKRSSQNAPGSLAASMDEPRDCATGSRGRADSLAASQSQSQLTVGRSGTHSKAASQSQGASQRVTRQRSSCGRNTSVAEEEPEDEQEDLDQEHSGELDASMPGGAMGPSAGMDSMPQALAHGSNDSLGMESIPVQLQDDDADIEEGVEDEDMQDADASDGEGHEEASAEEEAAVDDDEEMAGEESEDDSEPEETMLKPVRRRR